nr:reverse transcriptase [Ipomoea batatas]
MAKLVEDKQRDTRMLHPNPPLLPLPAPKNQNTNPRTALPIKRLIVAELQARRAQGLSYNCDRRFLPGHRCQTKPFLLLLTDDQTDTNNEGNDPETCDEDGVIEHQDTPTEIPEIHYMRWVVPRARGLSG